MNLSTIIKSARGDEAVLLLLTNAQNENKQCIKIFFDLGSVQHGCDADAFIFTLFFHTMSLR